MVSTIHIGPEGGPYVKVEENNGTLDITTPNDTVDLQSNELVNAALGGIMNANGNDITNVNQLDANSVNTSELLTADIRSGGGDQIQINYIGSLADGGTTALSASDDTNGIVFVRTGNAAHAEISTRGGFEAVQIMSDPSSSFSTTQGNSGTYNVYYNSTAGRYELENQTGGSRGGIATWAFDAPF